jgi:Tfp pilus assembly protein PilO
MINLRDVRTQLLVVVGVLLLLSLGAIGLLVSPVGRSRGAREQEYERLRMEKIEKTRTAAPVQGMDKKIEAAREEETQFNRERLVQHYSVMSEQLSRIASEAGVNVSTVKYDEHTDKSIPLGFDAILITIQLQGSYAQDMRFINAVERQKMMLLIDAITFGGIKGDTLTVSVHMSTFLRSAA